MSNKQKNNTMENTKKVIAFYRVSTEKQELERQADVINRALTLDEYKPTQVIEIGKKESGVLLSAAEREGINALKSHVENGNIAAVYVHELSRLSRRAADTFMLRDYLQQHHVQLICLNPSIKCFTDDWKIDPTANMIFGIMASMAENEGMIRKERMKTGKDRCRRQGQAIGGRAKYGYNIVKKADKRSYYEVNEEQKAVVRRIYNMFLNDGMSARQIAIQLYKEGVINQPREASREKFVSNILRDRAYLGKVSEGGNVVFEPFVSAAEQQAAIEKLTAAKVQPRTWENKIIAYGLGLLVAPDPEAKAGYYNMVVHRSANQYIPRGLKAIINADLADSLLLQATAEYIKEHGKVNVGKVAQDWEVQVNAAVVMGRKAAERIEEINAKIERVERRYIDGKISEATADAMRADLDAELRREKATAADAALRVERLTEAAEQQVNDNDVDLYALADEERRDTIKKYVERATVERTAHGTYTVTISYKMSDYTDRYTIHAKARKYGRGNGAEWGRTDSKMLDRYPRRVRQATAIRKAA